MTTCVKSQSVMEKHSERIDSVLFVHPDWNETTENRTFHCDRQFVVNREDWESMGKPATITLTIEIGDALNEA